MSFRFIEDHRDSYQVRLMCAVLEFSPAGYYAWRERPVSKRTKSSAALLAAIRQVHQDSWTLGRYGSPRVPAVLHRQGRGASRGRIERLMHRNGIRTIMAPPRRVRTTDSRHGLPIAPNLIARDFRATAPNRVWLADITYIPTSEGWLYLAAVMDLFSRKIVGWAMRGSYASRTRASGADDGRQTAAPAGPIATITPRWKASFIPSGPRSFIIATTRPAPRHSMISCLDRGLLQPNKAPFRNRIYRPERWS